MSDDFRDPLNDPRFPDRPNSTEFWRLVSIGLAHDASAEGPSVDADGKTAMQRKVEEFMAWDDLLYYAEHRIGNAGFDLGDPRAKASLVALWLDAFCKGADFAKLVHRG